MHHHGVLLLVYAAGCYSRQNGNWGRSLCALYLRLCSGPPTWLTRVSIAPKSCGPPMQACVFLVRVYLELTLHEREKGKKIIRKKDRDMQKRHSLFGNTKRLLILWHLPCKRTDMENARCMHTVCTLSLFRLISQSLYKHMYNLKR